MTDRNRVGSIIIIIFSFFLNLYIYIFKHIQRTWHILRSPPPAWYESQGRLTITCLLRGKLGLEFGYLPKATNAR